MHAIDHLADRLALDRQAGRRRIGNADAREQKPHVIVDFGDGADGRAGILRRRLLLDRNRRREAVDLVDVGLLHHLEKLARIGRQRFDIAALAFGIDRVEGERGFARARKAGEHHQLVARDGEVDVLEIMLARAANDDGAALETVRGAFPRAPAASGAAPRRALGGTSGLALGPALGAARPCFGAAAEGFDVFIGPD